ncbi:MAG: acylneuraminate cytidylyltransferase family protein [Candidatus Schekmanbacteria bacterium]|nr:acylneuraminate cytidylyltransferase family protein [Candidatus Schekmanbacteria bacterium]
MEPFEITALVPMRHASERVPGKNYRPFAGKPLFHHIVSQLLSCPAISSVVVNTDSPIIAAQLAEHFPTVRVLHRPPSLCGGMVPMNDVLCYDVMQTSAPIYLQTHSTNPLLGADTIGRAIEAFRTNTRGCDSLFSVTPLRTRLWFADGSPVNHDPAVLIRTQDLTPIYLENSCLYMFRREVFLRTRNRIGESPMFFEMSPLEAVDIDEELDFSIAEHLYTTLKGPAR